MPSLPAPHTLAPIDPHKRALTTIYAPRKLKSRKNKTAQTRMLEQLPVKPSSSPFHPLPAIGQKLDDKTKTEIFVFDLKNDRIARVRKLHDADDPLPPPQLHGYTRKQSLEPLPKDFSSQLDTQPQQLIRANTYDVIEPVFVNAAIVKNSDKSSNRIKRENDEGKLSATPEETEQDEMQKVSPKTRFKKAAIQVAKLSSMPETGKLLCLRERQTFNLCKKERERLCTLQELPRSPAQKLTKLSEIFQCLDTKGRHREKMKIENSWF